MLFNLILCFNLSKHHKIFTPEMPSKFRDEVIDTLSQTICKSLCTTITFMTGYEYVCVQMCGVSRAGHDGHLAVVVGHLL